LLISLASGPSDFSLPGLETWLLPAGPFHSHAKAGGDVGRWNGVGVQFDEVCAQLECVRLGLAPCDFAEVVSVVVHQLHDFGLVFVGSAFLRRGSFDYSSTQF
jgi:hypothetical protein